MLIVLFNKIQAYYLCNYYITFLPIIKENFSKKLWLHGLAGGKKGFPKATAHKDIYEKSRMPIGRLKRRIPRGRKSARCFFAFNTDFNNCESYSLNMKTRRIE